VSSKWLIISGDFVRSGGQDRANYELAKYLAGCGEAVYLICHRVDDHLRPLVHVCLVPRPWNSHFLGGWLLRAKAHSLYRRLTSAGPLRVVANGGNFASPDVNWVHAVHAAWRVSDRGAPLFERLKLRIVKFVARYHERRALGAARLVLVNSDRSRDALLHLFELDSSSVHRVYPGLDESAGSFSSSARLEARRRLGVNHETTVIGFIGALGYDRTKGFDLALRIVAQLQSRFQGRVLLIAAGVGTVGLWQSEIRRNSLDGRVQLLGHLSSTREMLAACDFMLAPSRYDSYGLAAAEALGSEIPAFLARTSGVAERVPGELRWLVLDDVEDVARNVQQIGTAFPLKQHQVKALSEFAKQLRLGNWMAMAERIKSLAEGQSSPGRR
jgi:hypothetical protein